MYVLFLNVKRRGTPWLTNNLTDYSVASRVVVMVQALFIISFPEIGKRKGEPGFTTIMSRKWVLKSECYRATL